MASSQLQIRPPMGLLTTVAELPPSYKVRYVAATKLTTTDSPVPLDLTVKQQHGFGGAITPPLTPSPLKKRYREDNDENRRDDGNHQPRPAKQIKLESSLKVVGGGEEVTVVKKEATPVKPVKSSKNSAAAAGAGPVSKERRTKATRKLKFDEETTSPVSGTVIISLEEVINGDGSPRESGDIDPQFNLVEISDEVRAELATIPNVIGAYNCKLCRLEFDDAFGLAQHRCACIVLLEYRCPECSKRFNCPANLASHRRWHKPRDQVAKKGDHSDKSGEDPECKYRCEQCQKSFKRPAYLKKHQLTHNKPKKSKNNQPSSASSSSSSSETATISPSSSDELSNHSSSNTVYVTPVTELPQTVFTVVASEPPLRTDLVQQQQQHRYSSPEVSEDSDDDDDDDERALVINEDYPPQYQDQRSMDDDLRSSYCDRFTEEENIAAAALAHLRNGPSVIRHTTALVV